MGKTKGTEAPADACPAPKRKSPRLLAKEAETKTETETKPAPTKNAPKSQNVKEVPKGKPEQKKEEPQDEKQEDPAENGEAKVEEAAAADGKKDKKEADKTDE
ncbi:non-histone chromosomal protein HMG-14A-like [Hippocampus zosterae]|uniref:non-histone chromosomal protein HMG-14A-like n=1 Tax=Hippocampus zosterae TaxID=109293 RepID=UPI00223D82B2|nr:non-histone chromosomal protein HMG-14A-like [Hippocampus zosterae]